MTKRPADEPGALVDQIVNELKCLSDRSGAAAAASAYLSEIVAKAWYGVSRGDPSILERLHEALTPAISWAEQHRSDGPVTRDQVALEILQVSRSLQIASSAIQVGAFELELVRGRAQSATAREILRVLREAGTEYLRRGEIQKRIRARQRPTAVRVGQVVAEMHSRGLVVRVPARARGATEVAFYALSPLGERLCDALSMARPDSSAEQLPKQKYYEELSAAIARTSDQPVFLSTLFKGDLQKHPRAWDFHQRVLKGSLARPINWIFTETTSSQPLVELAQEAARRSGGRLRIYLLKTDVPTDVEVMDAMTPQVLDDAGYVYPASPGYAERWQRDRAMTAWQVPRCLANRYDPPPVQAPN